jgi:uncharacterized protein
MSTLYIIDAMNLFCGVVDPTASKHLSLQGVKLPSLEETMKEHEPGGGHVGIEIPVGVGKLEIEFKIVGFDPQMVTQFGLNSRVSHLYTMYGAIIDRRSGKAVELKAIAEGRLSKLTQEEFKRGDLSNQDCKISGLTHYEVWFDGKEQLYWDFFTNAWRVNGVDEMSAINSILRVPNSIIGG